MSISDSKPDSERRVAWPERSEIVGRSVKTHLRVRYAETDKMGVAYYSEYLVWFEVMRGDFMRALGVPYTDMEAEGYFLPIAEANVRYLAPARYDDVVTVTATLGRIRARAVTFKYVVSRGPQVLARGSTTHIPVDQNGRPKSLSQKFLAPLLAFAQTPTEGPESGQTSRS